MEGDTIISFAALLVSGTVAVLAFRTFSKKTEDDRTTALEKRIDQQDEVIAGQEHQIDTQKADIIQLTRELQVCKDSRYDLLMELREIKRGQ